MQMPFGGVCAFDARRASLQTPQRRSTRTTDAFCHTARSLFRTQILISSLASLSCKTASRLFLPYFLRHAIVKKQTHHTNTHSNRPCVSPFLRWKQLRAQTCVQKLTPPHTRIIPHLSFFFQFLVKKNVMLVDIKNIALEVFFNSHLNSWNSRIAKLNYNRLMCASGLASCLRQ